MTADTKTPTPLILLGAGRSGTNMLRDALSALPGAGTWPCDEINYIWRHGNARHPTDELEPAHATPRVRRYVRRRFAQIARRGRLSCVVEKTCANSLRVGFVRTIFPEAKLVFLVRDGRDVVASAMERWRAPLDLPYILRKARYLPLLDAPYYATRYLGNRLYQMTSGERRLSFWGPRFEGMKDIARAGDLATLCAHQWVRCVERTEEGLAGLPPKQVFRLRYEDFVGRPDATLRDLARFAGIEATDDQVSRCVGHVSVSSVGRWRRRLTEEQRQEIEPILEPQLVRHGYDVGA